MPNPIKTGLPAIMGFFGMKVGEFRKEWDQLTESDKEQLKSGIKSFNADTKTVTGPLTY